jgi:hypothetical protein
VHSRFLNRVHRQWLISLLLVAVGIRALIPAGFMPSNDRPFTFEICPDGFPAQLLHEEQTTLAGHAGHHHQAQGDQGTQPAEKSPHEHGAARAQHCVFAAAATVGPAPQITLLLAPVASQVAPQSDFTPNIPEQTRHRVQQPRAPPALS